MQGEHFGIIEAMFVDILSVKKEVFDVLHGHEVTKVKSEAKGLRNRMSILCPMQKQKGFFSSFSPT